MELFCCEGELGLELEIEALFHPLLILLLINRLLALLDLQ